MLLADPATLLFVTTVVGLVIALLLFVSHVGLGEEAPALRWWIAGDLAVTASRSLFLLQPGAFGQAYPGIEWVTPTFAFIAGTFLLVSAVVMHGASLARLAGRRCSVRRASAIVVAVPTAYLAGASALGSYAERVPWLLGFIAVVIVAEIAIVRPIVARYRGTRILVATLAVVALLDIACCVGFMLQPAAEPPAGTVYFSPMPSLVTDFVISLLLTISIMLTLQERLRARIVQLSVTDPLTGLLNRRGAIPMLERELARTLLSGHPLSIALLDLDHFKKINDSLGHATGDEVLVLFARRLEALKRQSDVFARWGGEEFLIALPETGRGPACVVLERMRASVADSPLAPRLPIVTVSCGIAAIDGRNASARLEGLLEAADRSLYAAKVHRNCVVAGSTESVSGTDAPKHGAPRSRPELESIERGAFA